MFRIVVTLLLSVLTIGCDTTDPVPPMVGYWQFYGTKIDESVSYDAGEREDVLYSVEAETVIPIILVTDWPWLLGCVPENWEKFRDTGRLLLPEDIYSAAGYDSYPNDIGFEYTFKWVICSTYKLPGSQYGRLSVKWERNPYNIPRKVIIYMKNFDEGILVLCQDQNPDGVAPPEGTVSDEGFYIGS